MNNMVRTRFAPSPTGYMHVGNLRTALYTYLIAKKNEGKFILRIEDTDQGRLVEGATDIIYNTLNETGLIWDEGPDIGGDFGPYIQSQRMGTYMEYALQLIEKGEAYYCFCQREKPLAKDTEDVSLIQKYDGRCSRLSKEEVQKSLDANMPFVIRQHIPSEGSTSFDDVVFGSITVENSELDDQILIKSDGMPTYNFANVIDDHLMGITHVIRGSEYLSSTPKYNLLYKAFGWDVPVYIHCSPVMKNQSEKLSKRNGDASYQDLIEKGYIGAAVLNYIALLGWSPGGEQEIYSLPEMVQAFDINYISKSPAIFDGEKLKYINSEYIRALDVADFKEIAMPWIKRAVKSEIYIDAIIEGLQKRCEILSDIPEQLDFIDVLPDYDIELFNHKKMKTNADTSVDALAKMLPVLENIADWNKDSIHDDLFALIAEMGVKNGYVLWPLRVALSGKAVTPGGGTELALLMGKEASIERIKIAINKLS